MRTFPKVLPYKVLLSPGLKGGVKNGGFLTMRVQVILDFLSTRNCANLHFVPTFMQFSFVSKLHFSLRNAKHVDLKILA